MIRNHYLEILQHKINNFATVAILGMRQVGKTTLAQEIAKNYPAIYLDLENYRDLIKLEDPRTYFENHRDKLIILDEIHRKPEIFMTLRGMIDDNRRLGKKHGQFLILGSASIDLLKQSSESLAGRITYLEMTPFNLIELPNIDNITQKLWLRGGLPESFLANSIDISDEWRQSFITTYLERDIGQFDNSRIEAPTLRRLLTILAHCQGDILNISKISNSLGIDSRTIARYIDLFTKLFLLRRLQPWHSNLGKRMIRSPKTYIRDSGILHSLLNINNLEDIFSNPIAGKSWEGFVIENLLAFLPPNCQSYFYRSVRGAEIDLIIKHSDNRLIAIETKLSSAPKLERGFFEACQDIKPTHKYVVYRGDENFTLKNEVEAIGLKSLVKKLI